MPSPTRLVRLARVATLPETRGLIVAAARSKHVRHVAHRAATDPAGLLRSLRHPENPRARIREAASHPAVRELADTGLVFLPMRFLPLGWAATWVATRVLRRYVNRPRGS
jgi:hypothetical protein